MRKLRRNISYGVSCQDQFSRALKTMGKAIFKETMSQEKRGADKDIIVRTDFEHSTVIAEKLELIGPIMDDVGESSLKTKLHASALVLFQEVTHPIGILDNEQANNAKPYLRREEPRYNGIHPLPRDRTSKSNIDKLNMTLDVVTGTKFYSTVIKETMDLERKWRKSPREEEELARTHREWDFPTELVGITEARNALAVLSKKPITDEASLKFSVADHVKEALTSYPPGL